MRCHVAAFISLALSFLAARADDTLVVASIRQFQLAGASNIHLYLYTLDGTLKKQLTDTVGCDDLNPAFTYDGTAVFFTRKSTLAKTASEAGLYRLELATNRLTRKKYDETYVSVPIDRLNYSFAVPPASWNVSEQADCRSSDGSYRLTLKALPASLPNVNPPMRHWLSVNGSPPVDITTLPGLPHGLGDEYVSLEQLNGIPFVTAADFAATFLVHHLDSTDGDEIWALDLPIQRWTKLSQNGGIIYHPPGASGIFVDEESRYEPLGNTGQTVNCRYLKWWDNHFKMTKLTPPLSFFYSAAVFHPALGQPNGTNETLQIGDTTP